MIRDIVLKIVNCIILTAHASLSQRLCGMSITSHNTSNNILDAPELETLVFMQLHILYLISNRQTFEKWMPRPRLRGMVAMSIKKHDNHFFYIYTCHVIHEDKTPNF